MAETATLSVTVTVENPVPVGGYFTMSNPDIDYGFEDYLLDGWTIEAGTGLNGASLVADFTAGVLTVTGAITNELNSGDTFEFEITNFRNPYSTAVYGGFHLTTYDPVGGKIDEDDDATLKIS